MADLHVEIVETADGILEMMREGRKLVAVSYRPRAIALKFEEFDASDIFRCKHCRTFLTQNERGHYIDFADRFICRESPYSLHAVDTADAN